MKKNIIDIINHLKNQGFFFHTSEIYGGLSNAWDYGPLGTEMKENIKKKWINDFLKKIKNSFLIDSNIIYHPKVWQVSGHTKQFSDLFIDCKNCRKRFRVDKLISNYLDLGATKQENKISKLKCQNCNKNSFTPVRKFNLMFETSFGVLEDKKEKLYLRPETAQGIFVNFKNIQRAMRLKIPFAIGQIGRAFRNEITPGNFIFKTREFEQMEVEYFTTKENEKKDFESLLEKSLSFICSLGINKNMLRIRKHSQSELSHYSYGTSDIEYNFPFGWGEITGISRRSDFDLRVHQEASNTNLSYLDSKTNKKYIPNVVEPSFGLSRLIFSILIDAYTIEKIKGNEERIVLKINKELAPYRIAILPLVKKLSNDAYKIFDELHSSVNCLFDETGSIGKRYRRQDAIGTPFCITFDYDSLNDNKVTIRERDSMSQKRVKMSKILEYILEHNEPSRTNKK